MAKHHNSTHHDHEGRHADSAGSPEGSGPTDRPDRLRRKHYEAELRKLQVELVHLQEWVKATGAKVCVVRLMGFSWGIGALGGRRRGPGVQVPR